MNLDQISLVAPANSPTLSAAALDPPALGPCASSAAALSAAAISPIVIADRLISLAQEADRAGYRNTASDLVKLMYTVFDAPQPSPAFANTGFYSAMPHRREHMQQESLHR